MLLLSVLSFILGLEPLHKAGYQGQGMTIAVIDCGFYHANDSTCFPQKKIIGTYDLIEDSLKTCGMFDDMNDTHGVNCFSIMAYESDTFTGTAPKANYILIRTEDLVREELAELDRLERGIRLADSLGADVITISLGYSEFDDKTTNLTYKDMDGQSSLCQTATEVMRKGTFICVAAGNYGNSPWHYISTPADADSILTVGSCTRDSLPALSSSWGPTYDGRQKPEVCAWGDNTYYFSTTTKTIKKGSGTSYATPEVAGMVACLWQALRAEGIDYNALQLRDLIIANSHQTMTPDYKLGHGIPNAGKALEMAKKTTSNRTLRNSQESQQQKILKNGQLYIIRNGREYSILGNTIR